MKRMATLGSSGAQTGVGEYEINLEVSLLLEKELKARGYQVLMTRTSQDVLIGNVERAQMANKAGADAFIRIHCDGSNDPSSSGAMAVIISPKNPYHPENYSASNRLGQTLVEAYTEATGFRARKTWTTDSMTGLNWSEGPAVLFEMGFLSNPKEEAAMQEPAFQARMVEGLANGLDRYFQAGRLEKE